MTFKIRTAFIITACVSLTFCLNGFAYAQSKAELQKQLKSEQENKEVLKEKMEKIAEELDNMKTRLVDISASIQSNESELEDLEKDITRLEEEKVALTAKLEKDKASIADLVMTMERIRRVPPQALMLKPGAPLKTAQTVMLLKDIIPTIQKQAKILRADLENLNTITKTQQQKKIAVIQRSNELAQEQKQLSGLIEKRQSVFLATQEDYQESVEDIRQISTQSKSLKDLVQKLDERTRRSETVKASRNAVREYASLMRGNVPSASIRADEAQLPISGILRVRYDELDVFGAPSKGLTIEGRSGGLVVAPMSGTVRFTGSFKNYGNIVIIEHSSGYHSLVAGLEKIDTLVGQVIHTGEPIGILEKTVQGSKPKLYYELRHHGQPINPAKKFIDLG